MDSKRKLMIIAIAGILMLLAVVLLRSWLSAPEEPQAEVPPPKEIRIMVARRDLPLGSLLQPAADVDWVVTPPEEIKEDQLRDDASPADDFTNAVVRKPLRAGEPVTQSSLTKAGAGSFMSAVLEPGMRAVSLAVTETSGNAGFISPGDRVDLIVTHRIRLNNNTNPDGSVVSETFVRDVRVIAVDQQLDNPENKAILAKTVTVEVSPLQAEQIAVAADLGKISLALRSLTAMPEENSAQDGAGGTDLHGRAVTGESYTRDSDVSQALETGGGVSSTIRIIRGDQVESVSLR